ncbi:MAG TPA: DinB family protein [Bryobacteraceae bacterium]|nr:DinB family protein [Bryobacteraceae bacterium]
MSIAQSLLPEFDHEMASTRKMLERIPENKLDYKPDPKSMSMSQLASHVVEMCGWFGSMMEGTELDIPPDFKPFQATSRKQLLDRFDQNVASTRAALAAAGDQALMQDWSLKFSGNTMFTMPRIACYRSMIMNHVIHHRAQLSVYYRLNGVPVPGMYGPSADEAIPATAGH